MHKYRVVIDTNVLLAALMSKGGAAYQLFALIGKDKFDLSLSVPLVVEYESTAKSLIREKIFLAEQAIDDIIDFVCTASIHHEVYFLWRPFLNDPKDDMVLELAVSARADYIITYNLKDFQGVYEFGVKVVTPKTFLEIIGVLP